MKAPPIILKNVRVHNLKGVDLTLQPGELIVFTGVSGSGKSSLAFDTIYVEGQRRYIESLSHQSRRFLSELPKPEAESISGIAPTIAIEQKTSGHTPRSTVGTMTGIYDFIRVLFARIAIPYCPVSQEPVHALSKEKIIAQIQNMPKGTKLLITAPFARGKKGEFKEEFAELISKGFIRLKIDGEFVDLSDELLLNPKKAHDVDIVIDRIVVNEENKGRITEAVNTALDVGKGHFSANDTEFSQFAYSPKSGLSYPPLEPQDFSFNHPKGMCPECHGIGVTMEFDLDKIVNPEISIKEGAVSVASPYNTVRYGNIYDNLEKLFGCDVSVPWKKLSKKAQDVFLYGTKEKWTKMYFVHPTKRSRWHEYVQWRGVIHEAKERYTAAKSDAYRKKMGELMSQGVCHTCRGARIRPYPAAAQLNGKTIAELSALSLDALLQFFQDITLSPLDRMIAEELLKEICSRLEFLINVGIAYLSLDRISPTLSGGESQRVRLASQIGAGLVGAIYILDEPSIGLHPVDHYKLIGTLKHLRDQGNTVLVVEHDADTIIAADTVVDVGPGAGVHGGEILAVGTVSDLMSNSRSLTGGYLSGRLKIDGAKKRAIGKQKLTVANATQNNLKNVTVSFPLGNLITVTGVSGSGKSSLIMDTLIPTCQKQMPPFIDKLISIDQSPIGRTPRSNAATYIKLFDEIRDLFTQLPESKMRGFHAGHFSFNVKEGSCSYCHGIGQVKIDMDFMEDVWVPCSQCHGKRFESDILSIKFKGKSINDILEMDVEHALIHFEAIPSIHRKLEVLHWVGLDYLKLGQPSTTLSGGEAQRIKLAKELVRSSTGKTVYILDEPTTGLHFADIQRVIVILQRLVDKGNTVIVIEHNMDLVRCSDWVVELGPGAGVDGGEIVAEGTPKQIAKLDTATGKALRGLKYVSEKRKTVEPIENIVIENAAQNNLRNVSLEIPRGKMTVFTGPSGSGKTSLAFDTLYAEGQRRYTETLPAYYRSLIKQLPKPKVEHIEGLSASIALEQKTGGLNPRSTVGTITESYDHLRLMYAHLGVVFDPETGKEQKALSKQDIFQHLLTHFNGEKIHILAPILPIKKETFEEMIERLQKEGFLRVRLNGKIYEFDETIPFEKHRKNEIFLIVDRCVISPNTEMRMYESMERCREISDGVVVIATEKEDLTFDLGAMHKMTPQSFSFNHQAGMCLECQGLGLTYGARLEELDDVLPWDILEMLMKEKGSTAVYKIIAKYFGKADLNKEIFLNGGPEITMKNGLTLKWLGIHSVLSSAMRMGRLEVKEALMPVMQTSMCPACQGTRLNPRSRHVKVNNKTLPEVCGLNVEKAYAFIKGLNVPIFLQETYNQSLKILSFLIKLGLHYISLDRAAPTLSGGELQRIRLARQLGSGLTSCLYVLDEPTIGLHPYNNELLNSALKELQNLGNTLVLVEHDPMTIKEADYLFDFGPKAGKDGGQVVAAGTISEIMQNPQSLTGAYLSGRKKVPIPKQRRPLKDFILIEKATLHNLKNISVKIPKAAITCFTGVSGSGKSSLMTYLHNRKEFEKTIIMDQSPIGQTNRADVSTYSEINPLLRAFFGSLPLAKTKGLQPKHFSSNHIKGMCRTCWGHGYKSVNLQYLPAVKVVCEGCQGLKLNPLALDVRYKGKNLGETLKLTVEEALQWFNALPKVAKKLEKLIEVGLNYLQLDQELATLSGGEAQRLRLSRELSKRETGNTLYLIDEPTVGLHSEDVARLVDIFHRLANKKNTLVIVEHNLDLIANADYIVDLGPDAGDQGGEVMAFGTPEEVARVKRSKTGQYLRHYLF